jgi:preprotein translocase subunit SecD
MKFKILFVVLLIVGVSYYIYPPQEKVNLGLDLKGGIHMVVEVEMDEAYRAELEISKSNAESILDDESVSYSKSTIDRKNLSFTIEGIEQDKIEKAEKIFDDYFGSYEVTSFAPGSYRFILKSDALKTIRKQAMRQAMITINNRVDEFGVAEPVIQKQGLDTNRIVIELPGLDNTERVKKNLSEPGWLELRLVKGVFNSKEEALAQNNGKIPDGLDLMPGENGKLWYLVKQRVELNGTDIKTARRSADQFGSPTVSFTLNPAGVAKFSEVTRDNVGEMLAIILDKKVVSAPRIEGPINSPQAQITGRFTVEECEDLAIKLRSGALPASLKFLEERTVGPTLGKDSIRKGVRAAMIGLIIVMLFMLVWYKLAGLNANIALLLNMIFLLGGMVYLGATLTLPGIAGFILTIGMAVDANVIIFERIKEELKNGKTPKSAIDAGFGKALSAVMDANITTLIAALFLFQYGTGPVKGFAVTLSLGIIASMFTAVYISRMIFDIVLELKPNIKKLSI